MGNEEFYKEAADAIKACDKEKAGEVAQKALDAGMAPDDILKNGFIVGITEMGDLFERGQVFLPELVLASDAMSKAAAVCNAALPEGQAEVKEAIVVGTVQGDVHDIGKTIVVAFLRANGYDVHDLGRDISADKFIAKAEEVEAKVIGMSALLTTTMRAEAHPRGARQGRQEGRLQDHRRRRRVYAELGQSDRRRCVRGRRQRRRQEDQRAARTLTGRTLV